MIITPREAATLSAENDAASTKQTKPAPALRAFYILLAVAAGLAGYALLPFWVPIFLGSAFAMACQPLFGLLTRLFGGRRSLAAGLLVFLMFALLIAPLASIVAFCVQEVTVGLVWVRDELGVTSLRDVSYASLPPQIRHGLETFLQYMHITRSDLQTYTVTALSRVQALAPAVVGFSVTFVMDAFLMLVAFYFFTVDGHTAISYITRLSPLRPEQTEELISEFRNVSRAALVGTAVTALLQGLIVSGGFGVFGIPHAVFFGLVTLLASFIPVVGAALLWAPAALILAFTSHLGAAIGLALWCGLAIFLVEHLVKPLLMRGGAAIHAGLMFFGLLGGLAMFGIVGVIVGPLIIAFFLALLRMYERDFVGQLR